MADLVGSFGSCFSGSYLLTAFKFNVRFVLVFFVSDPFLEEVFLWGDYESLGSKVSGDFLIFFNLFLLLLRSSGDTEVSLPSLE